MLISSSSLSASAAFTSLSTINPQPSTTLAVCFPSPLFYARPFPAARLKVSSRTGSRSVDAQLSAPYALAMCLLLHRLKALLAKCKMAWQTKTAMNCDTSKFDQKLLGFWCAARDIYNVAVKSPPEGASKLKSVEIAGFLVVHSLRFAEVSLLFAANDDLLPAIALMRPAIEAQARAAHLIFVDGQERENKAAELSRLCKLNGERFNRQIRESIRSAANMQNCPLKKREEINQLVAEPIAESQALLKERASLGRKWGYRRVIGKGSPTFSVDDLKDASSLAAKLKAAADGVDRYIHDRLKQSTRLRLAQWQGPMEVPPALQQCVVEDLNAIVKGPSVWDADRFAKRDIRQATRDLLAGNPHGEELARLNRLLLDDAYQLELSRFPQTPYPRFQQTLEPIYMLGSFAIHPDLMSHQTEKTLSANQIMDWAAGVAVNVVYCYLVAIGRQDDPDFKQLVSEYSGYVRSKVRESTQG